MFFLAGQITLRIANGGGVMAGRPLNTPVEHSTKFDVVTNLEALGLTVSQTLLAAADEVIE